MVKAIPLKKKMPVAAGKPEQEIVLEIRDGILYGRYPEGVFVDVEFAKAAVKKRLAFSDNGAYPFLIDMRGIEGVSREARQYLGTEGARLIVAGALIVGSALNRMLGNIFLALQKPRVPTRLFDNEDEGLQWLKEYI